MWNQIYNPLGNAALSTVAAALPVVTLLVLIASGRVKAHIAAVIALIVANLITIFIYTMPAAMSVKASLLGVVVGFFPIGWIVLNVIFLYRITVETGRFELLKRAIGGVTTDRRLQLLLIAFAFGAFFEGASGFGTVPDRQYRAGRLWRAGYADPGARFGDRSRSLYPGRDGWPPVAVLLADRAVLADLGIRWVARDDSDLAGHPRDRRVVRGSAIPDLELHQSLDRRYRRIADLDGLSHPVPQGLATQGTLAVASVARQGRIGRHDDRGKAHGQDAADASPAVERATAMDHCLCRDADLGHRGVQDLGKLDLYLELPRSRTAQYDQQGAAGGAEADTGRCGVRLHLPVVHRNGHADRGDHFRFPDGLLAGQDARGVWPHHQAVRDFADHDFGDARDRHADATVGRRCDTRSGV